MFMGKTLEHPTHYTLKARKWHNITNDHNCEYVVRPNRRMFLSKTLEYPTRYTLEAIPWHSFTNDHHCEYSLRPNRRTFFGQTVRPIYFICTITTATILHMTDRRK